MRCRWVVNVIMNIHRREKNRENLLQIERGMWLLAFKMQEGSGSEKCILLETGKGNIFLLEHPCEILPLNTLVPAQWKSLLTSYFQNDNRKKKSLLFKDSSFLYLSLTPIGNTHTHILFCKIVNIK